MKKEAFGYPCEDRSDTDSIIGAGEHYIFSFNNGYGASVVCNRFSYGGEQGLYELAVLDSNEKITYNTRITDDVIGYLTPEEVGAILKEIAAL